MNTQNRAVKEHLRNVIAVEQRRTALFLARARAFGAFLGLGTAAFFTYTTHERDWAAALPFIVASAIFASVVALVVQLAPKLLRPSGALIAMVDLPAMTAMSIAVLPYMDRPAFLVGSTLPLAVVFVLTSGLTLNYAIITLTALSACATSVAVPWLLGAPPSEMALPVAASISAGVVTVYLVSRVRALVAESRRKDFAGKYIIGNPLGVGGMAEVFEATYSPEGGFERRVAVKRILPAFAQSPDAMAMFRREAAVGAMLAHPSIVQVLDFGCDGASYFLAMELIEGTSLARIMSMLRRTNAQLPVPAFAAVTTMMCDALQYIHTRTDSNGAPLKLVHRDVNPPNIFVSRLGEAKLGDFGIARAAAHEPLTRTGTFRGKLRYAAPEQLAHAGVDSRADLFSLGVTLHEALTGQRLFQGESEASVAVAVVQHPIPRVSARRPDVHPVIDTLVARLLERDVDLRFASAAEVARFLAHLPPELGDLQLGRKQLAALVEAYRTGELPQPVPAPVDTVVDADEEDTATWTGPVPASLLSTAG